LVYKWNGIGPDPYLSYLAHSDYFVISADNIQTISECCATGKPIYTLFDLGTRYEVSRFHKTLHTLGYTRRYSGKLGDWYYKPLNEVQTLLIPRLKAFLYK